MNEIPNDSKPLVLIVEDDYAQLNYMRRTFEREGYLTLIAGSAQEAEERTMEADIAVAFVDYRLPDGTGGEVIRRLRARHPSAQAIVLTGYGSRDVVLEAVQAGAFSYLEKPVEGETLLAYGRRALNLYRLGRESSHPNAVPETNNGKSNLQARELDAIGRIAALTSAEGEEAPFEQEVLSIVRETLGADAAFLFRFSATGTEFVLRSQAGLSEEEEKELAILDSSRGMIGNVGLSRRLVETENLHGSPLAFRHREDSPVSLPDLKTVIGCPLTAKGKLLGVLFAANRLPEPFLPSHRVLAASLSRQLGVVMENLLLSEMAAVDPHTALYNRWYFERRLGAELSRANRHGHEVTVCMADVDCFRAVNDSLGRSFGDEVLRSISMCIQKTIRCTDVAARYGGEEMALILPETGLGGGKRVGEKLRAGVADLRFPTLRHLISGEDFLRITMSIGIATFPVHGKSSQDLVQRAGDALRLAKSGGMNQVICVDEA